jgi:hypothetical protein
MSGSSVVSELQGDMPVWATGLPERGSMAWDRQRDSLVRDVSGGVAHELDSGGARSPPIPKGVPTPK